jgi:hypothetical protein
LWNRRTLFISITLHYVFALLHNALTLSRSVIASYYLSLWAYWCCCRFL